MKRAIKIVCVLISFSLPNEASTVSVGNVFEAETNRSKLLFVWKRSETSVGNQQIIRAVHLNPDQTEAVVEEVHFEKGQLTRYFQDHKQRNEKGSLAVRNGKVHFSYIKDGTVKEDEEDLTDNFVVGPILFDYLKVHWKILLAGEDVSVRFAALDRLETVGFKFFKVDEKKVDGNELVVIKMKPTSIIIAALVDPLYFTFTKKEAVPIEYRGRVLPKARVNGKWEDLDAEVVYQH